MLKFLNKILKFKNRKTTIRDHSVQYFSNKGKRKYQEDYFYVSKDKKLLIVCDGVGGNVEGCLASQTVVHHIKDLYDKNKGIINKAVLTNYIISANRRLNQLVNENIAFEGLATTIALCFIGDNSVLTCHVGDSRIIFFDRTNKKIWASSDHSLVQELLDNKILSSEQDGLAHPLRNQVTRIIQGSNKNDEFPAVETHEIKSIHTEDLLLICSDGVLEEFTSEMIGKQFMKEDYMNRWLILKDHCTAHSKDNNTAILVKF